MDAAIKQQWVEALRSGKYEQGREALRTEAGGYCCLGVLCDLLPEKGTWDADNSFVLSDGNAADGSLPDPLRVWLGITREQQTALIYLNDGEFHGDEVTEGPQDFNVIADYIEANL